MAVSLHRTKEQFVWLGLALAMVASFSARAEEQVINNDIQHEVKNGDTLEQLAVQYYGRAQLWTELQKRNLVANPRHLKPGSVVKIPVRFMPQESAEVGFVQGQATVIMPDAKDAPKPLVAGQKLPEGAQLQVAPESFVTVRLADGTLIRVQAQSDIQLQQLRRKGRSGSLQSIIEMNKGSVNSTVGSEPDPNRRFDVRTPTSTTSVRGTTFGVSLAEDGSALSSVVEGKVAVRASNAEAAIVNGGQGVAVSSGGQLGTPKNLLPAPDLSGLPESLGDPNFLSFSLQPLNDATSYQVQVARDAAFTEVLRSGQFKTAQIRLKHVDDGEYYVAAIGVDAQQLPGLPAVRKIKVKTQPTPPLYQQPQPDATTSRTSGTLLCTRVSGVQSYRIQVAATPDFAKPLLDETISNECTTGLASLPPGSYHWRAASIRTLSNGQPDQGPFAPPQAFKLADSPAAMNSAALVTNEDLPGINLVWPGEPNLTYELQVSRSESFAEVLVDEKLTAPQWASSALKPGEYFVRIRTSDTTTGLQSPYSAARQVRAAAQVRSGYGLPLTSSDGEPLTRP